MILGLVFKCKQSTVTLTGTRENIHVLGSGLYLKRDDKVAEEKWLK